MKKILVTGISRGIGKAIAEIFLENGWYVIGTSTSGNSSFKHHNLEIHKLELLDSKSIKSFVNNLNKKSVKIDVLVNNAGVYEQFDQITDKSILIETLRKILEVNLIGLITITENLLPQINNGGHIINISSGAASLANFMGAFAPLYQISKVGVNMYTRTLASRLKKRKIVVSCLDPGWVKTDMGGPNAPREPSEIAKEIFNLAISKVKTGSFWYRGSERTW